MSAGGAAAPRTRRAFLRRSTGATALLLAGCGGNGGSRTPSKPLSAVGASPQAMLLNSLLDLEHETIAAYTAGIPLLGRRQREAGKRFLDQELSHSGELAGLVKQAGGKPGRMGTYRLGEPRGAGEVMSLLAELERREVATLLAALPRLEDPQTRAAVAAIAGNDAQHLALVHALSGQDPLPAAILPGGPAR